MSRSLKKGPYINVKLENKVLTSWVNLPRPVHSAAMQVTRKNNDRKPI